MNRTIFVKIYSLLILITACQHGTTSTATNNASSKEAVLLAMTKEETVTLPFIKNSASECYYLDDFMPTPQNLVTGKQGLLNLRYYSYRNSHYKMNDYRNLILCFYSHDNHCWSLFEEYYSE